MSVGALRLAAFLTASLAVARVAMTAPLPALPFPNGLATLWPGAIGLAGRHPGLVALAMAFFIVGGAWAWFRPGRWALAGAVALSVTTALHLAVTTAANSQGAIHHGQQLLSQTLLLLSAVALWSLRHRRDAQRERVELPPQRVIDLVTMVVASAYLGAGLRKLLATGGRWMLDAPLLVADIVKTTRDHQVDVGTPVFGALPPATALLVEHPALAGVAFSFGLLLELCAPLALLGRLPAIVVGTLLIMFHRLAAGLMGLSFPDHEALLLVWCVVLPLWSWWRSERRP